MSKFLNKWLRKIHRWLAIPFILIIVVVFSTRQMAVNATIQRVQMGLMLFLALTGLYLFLLPYLTRWQRGRRTRTQRIDAPVLTD